MYLLRRGGGREKVLVHVHVTLLRKGGGRGGGGGSMSIINL